MLKDLWTSSENNQSQPYADEVSLAEVIGVALDGFKTELARKKSRLKIKFPPRCHRFTLTRQNFFRLFELLFKDELAMLPAGSKLSLSAELKPGAKPEILVQISDNGPGLPEEALRVIFDPFTVRGSVPSEYGIHLMACFFIVHHHGGKIEAQNLSGRGTTFSIRLPLKPEPVAESPDETQFLQKALLNENLWEKLLTSG